MICFDQRWWVLTVVRLTYWKVANVRALHLSARSGRQTVSGHVNNIRDDETEE